MFVLHKYRKYHGKSGAGILFICLDDKTILLAKRARKNIKEPRKNVMEPGTWGIPGGKKDKNDPSILFTAIREAFEELTVLPQIEYILKKTIFKDGYFKYTTYFCVITKEEKDAWEPILNWEHEQTRWFKTHRLPYKLHFGIKIIKRNIEKI